MDEVIDIDRRPPSDGEPARRLPIPHAFHDRDPDRSPFDPPTALDQLGQQAPVSRVSLLDGSAAFVVTGYDEARHVLTDPSFSADRFTHPSSLRPGMWDPDGAAAGMFAAMDPPRHTRYRRLLTGEFTMRRMRALEPRILDITTVLIDAMLAEGTGADLVSAFALPLPSLVICELLGVPYDDRAEFQVRSSKLLRLDTPQEQVDKLTGELAGFLLRLVADKRADPTDDLISSLVASDTDPALTDTELVNIARQLLVAGHETTANMLALGTFALLSHPEQLQYLRDDLDRVDAAVEELLRYLSIAHLSVARVTTEEVELAGLTLPAKATVMVALPEVNRDPTQWTNPQELQLDRPRCPHLAFGFGVHQCLGQQLARAEMTIGFTELLRRLPELRLAVPPSDVPLRTDMGIYGVHSLPISWA